MAQFGNKKKLYVMLKQFKLLCNIKVKSFKFYSKFLLWKCWDFKQFVIGYCKKNESRKEAKHDKQYVNQYDKAL